MLTIGKLFPKLVRRYFTGAAARYVFDQCDQPGADRITATGLYLHIPFCRNLCPYCPYNKIAYAPSLVAPYLEAVLREIDLYAARYGRLEITSVYIGGGTPTLLAAELQTMLGRLRERFDVTGDICIETGPLDLTGSTIAALREMGIKLVSVGAQSFQDRHLAFIGRNYRAADLPGHIRLLQDADFASVNLDLIFALPGQTETELRRDLDAALALGVDQVTAYPLFTFPYPHTEVMVDVCKTCEGIWLDANEFSQIKAARESAPPPLAPDELLVCPKCGKEQPQSPECMNCGLIFAKYWAALKEKEPIAKPSPPQYEHKPRGAKESLLDFIDRTVESLKLW